MLTLGRTVTSLACEENDIVALMFSGSAVLYVQTLLLVGAYIFDVTDHMIEIGPLIGH